MGPLSGHLWEKYIPNSAADLSGCSLFSSVPVVRPNIRPVGNTDARHRRSKPIVSPLPPFFCDHVICDVSPPVQAGPGQRGPDKILLVSQQADSAV